MSSQVDLQALIDETEALGWDKPDQLDALVDAPPNQEAFAFVGKAPSLKPLHTLTAVWSFAAPLAMEAIAPNKYLFAVPQQKHLDRIFQQGPWNIRGSLLLLQPWSPELTIDEIEPCLCSFWVQVHRLPHTPKYDHQKCYQDCKAIGSLLFLMWRIMIIHLSPISALQSGVGHHSISIPRIQYSTSRSR